MNSSCKIAIVGAGSFASNIYPIFKQAGCELCFIVDEFKAGDYLGVPIIKANKLTVDLYEQIDKFVIAISTPLHCAQAVQRLVSCGIPTYKIFSMDSLPSLTITSLIFSQFRNTAIDFLKSSLATSVFTLEEKFYGQQWKQAFNQFDSNKQTIAFSLYSKGGGFRRHIAGLIPKLKDNYNLIALSDERVSEISLGIPELFMAPETASNFDNIDTFITAHVGVCSHKKKPRVNFLHSSFWFVECDNQAWRSWMLQDIESADPSYIVAPTQSIFNMYKALLETSTFHNRVCLIPGGYPRLDDNISYFQKNNSIPNSIIYAPTLSFNNSDETWYFGAIAHSAEIVKSLLENFPHLNIIVRFHPRDMAFIESMQGESHHPHSKPFLDIMGMSRSNPRCNIDGDKTFYMETYSQCLLMVSDLSSTAFSYALSTVRPAIFFSPRDEELKLKYNNSISTFIRDRNEVGAIASSLDSMVDAINKVLKQPDIHTQKIEKYRDKICYNLGNAENYIVDNMKYIINSTKHPDWAYFNWTSD